MRIKINRVLGLVLGLIIMIAPTGSPAVLSSEKLYGKVLPSVMTLEVETQTGEKFVGSAVLALADDVALTAWHVVADARSVWAVFADGQRVRVTGFIDRDDKRDVALLKLEKHVSRQMAVLSRKLQPVAARAYVIGAPKGLDFSISDGLISQTRMVSGVLQYQLSCPISPGNSGSPIFNQRGEVIGIALWTKSDAQNVNFAIPAEEYMRLDISKSPTTWAQLAAITPVVPPARLTKLRQTTDPVLIAKEKVDAKNYAAFQKWLHDSAGKSVTVAVLEDGQTNSFTFTVR